MFADVPPAIRAGKSAPVTHLQRTKKASAFQLFAASSQVRDRNIVALIDQRDPMGGGWQRVKVVRDRRGPVFKLVLSPLKSQGVASLDDGKLWKTVLPDEKVVLSQRSVLHEQAGRQDKLRLARQNYSFAVEGYATVAGRRCYKLQAKPFYTELATWTLYLDAGTNFALRMDTTANNTCRVEFISRAVDYPRHLDPSATKLETPSGYKTLEFERPAHVPAQVIAHYKVGFEPLVPRKLPLGFAVEDVQMNTSNAWNSLIFRLTDGMARASVYEFKATNHVRGLKPFENSTEGSFGNVRIMVVSDIAEACRQRLIDCFASASAKIAARNLLYKP